MSSLTWKWTGATCWHAESVAGHTWRIGLNEAGMFHLVDNNRLPYNAAPFHRLRSAKAWCEEREAELIAEQPKRRLAKLYERTEGDGYEKHWVYDSESSVPPSSSVWKCVGSAWVTEGEFADD